MNPLKHKIAVPSVPAFHGGSFFDAIGPSFSTLHRIHGVINADVLDAWFPPAPGVLSVLHEYLSWMLRTSPPTHAEGLIDVLSTARGVPAASLLPGAGSSDLIFLAFLRWLDSGSRVLMLDPTYGEYPHLLRSVLNCHVDTIPLRHSNAFDVDLEALSEGLARGYDMVVLVNPNSPTGRFISRRNLSHLLALVAPETIVWVDETYIEYVGVAESLESFAASSKNVIVCKSMSKVYALSGVRVAYLCGPERLVESLRPFTPPWSVSLPAQVAAVAALQDPHYYSGRYAETHRLRELLVKKLQEISRQVTITPGVANFLLCQFPENGPTAAHLVEQCARQDVYLRDVSRLSPELGPNAVRIAVKSEEDNLRIVDTLRTLLLHG